MIAADIARLLIESALSSELYNSRDHPGLFLFLSEVYSTTAVTLSRRRVADAIYAVQSKGRASHKSGRALALRDTDIQKATRPESAAEFEAKALSHLFLAAFHVCRFAAKVGAFGPVQELPFYNPKKVYESRFAHIAMLDLKSFKYDQFAEAFAFETKTAEELIGTARGFFEKARDSMKKVLESERTEARVAVARGVVESSVAVARWEPGKLLEMRFDGTIPVFRIKT
jgi:hypothetical protein